MECVIKDSHSELPVFTRGKTGVVYIAVIIAVSFCVYFNSLYNGFVYDDHFQVLENHWIKDTRHIPEIFTSSVSGFSGAVISNYYRPTMHLAYMADYMIFGLTPWGFHLVNVLVHTGVSVLVFLLIYILLGLRPSAPPKYRGLPAFMGALLFATHPVHTEAVAWVAGIPELLFTFFFLLSFYLYIRSNGGIGTSYYLSLVFFFLGALSKETALTLPVILFIYDRSYMKAPEGFRYYIKRLWPYILVAGVYLIIRMYALGGIAPARRHPELSAYLCAINIFPLFEWYLIKLLLPVNLNAFHVFHPIKSIFEFRGIFSIAITAAFAALAAFSVKSRNDFFFVFIFIAATLLPVLYIPGVGVNTFAERYLYLPSFGLVLLISFYIARYAKSPGATMSMIAAFSAVICIYSIGTVNRNAVWRDNYSLWSDTVKKSPDAAEPHNDFALALYNKGDIDGAIRESIISLSFKEDPRTLDTLGRAYFKKGLVGQAIEQYKRSLALDPDSDETHYNLGLAYNEMGLEYQAIEEYSSAIRLKPSVSAYLNLGIIYATKGWFDKAVEQYKSALILDPFSADAYYNLGLAYKEKNEVAMSIDSFKKALKLKPDDADTHNNLGIVYAENGRIDSAVEQFEAAVSLQPANSNFRINLNKAITLKDRNRLIQKTEN